MSKKQNNEYIGFRINKDLKKQFEEKAKSEDRTPTDQARKLIKDYINAN